MKFKFPLFLPFSILFCNWTFGQIQENNGKITILQDDKITTLVANCLLINEKAKVAGYRVKIHFGSDKAKSRDVKAKFSSSYPDVPAYEKYDQPNFNIRVGDFQTKLEAYRLLKKIQIDFPTSFIVQDFIELPGQ